MKYIVMLKAEVAVFDPAAGKFDRKETTIDFAFPTATAAASLIREMVAYADDPLELRIKREDD